MNQTQYVEGVVIRLHWPSTKGPSTWSNFTATTCVRSFAVKTERKSSQKEALLLDALNRFHHKDKSNKRISGPNWTVSLHYAPSKEYWARGSYELSGAIIASSIQRIIGMYWASASTDLSLWLWTKPHSLVELFKGPCLLFYFFTGFYWTRKSLIIIMIPVFSVLCKKCNHFTWFLDDNCNITSR